MTLNELGVIKGLKLDISSSEQARAAKRHIYKMAIDELKKLIKEGSLEEKDLADALWEAGGLLDSLGDYKHFTGASADEVFEKADETLKRFDQFEESIKGDGDKAEDHQETGDFEPTEEDVKIQKQIAKTQKALDKAIKATLKTIKLLSAASEEGKDEDTGCGSDD